MQDAYAVVQRWEEAFNRGDAEAVAALYAPTAAIWGTLAQYIATSPTEILDYFHDAARAEFRVKLGAYVLLPIGEAGTMICGHYELSRPAEGRILALPARYSFVLTRQDSRWLILHQHSSFMPTPAG
jgi:uncharacterized protein (TIGR02246 family)